MRLISLEIHGFKSFADKTIINFNESITGVVGPNGCGKSNVIDSIRWVLGEQRTKALRSDKMDNLIFNGTKIRKGAKRAEVCLTFENNRNLLPTEFSTVSVTRILYRTGESEYKINDVNCRLKDISSLFMDTGISSDSYAIIELSMVNDILSDKDNVRRKLFEQASGISKYKKRKRETLNKLNATENDLDRVEDLLAEIEGNLKTLEKQAKKAARYNKIKAQYKELSIELAVHKLSNHKGSFDSIKEKGEEERNRKETIVTRIAEIESEIAQTKIAQSEKEDELGEAQIALSNHVDKLRFEENNKGLLNEKIKFLTDKKASLKNGIENDKANIGRLKNELIGLNENVTEEEQQLENIVEELKVAKEDNSSIKLKFAEHKEQLNKLESVFRELEHNVFGLEKEIAIKHNQKENLIKELSQSKIQFQSKEEELEDLKKLKSEQLGKLNTLDEEVKALQKDRQDKEEQALELENKIEDIREQYITTNRDLDSKLNEHALTKSLIDNLEGYSNATKYLKTLEGWSNSAILISELLDCEESYKLCLENYLRPVLEHYVITNYEQAQAAIDLLKMGEKGKASFYLLDELTKIDAKTAEVKGFTKAVDVIKVGQKFVPLTNYILQNVYISPNGFEEFPFQKYPDAVVLTQNGEIIRHNGLVSGGSVGAFEGKTIGRIQNLEKLEKDIEKLQSVSTELNQEIKTYKATLDELKRALNKKELAHKQNLLAQQNNKMASLDARIANYQQFLEENTDKFATMQQNIEQLEKEIDNLNEELDDVQASKDQQQNLADDFRNVFISVERSMNQTSESYNQLNLKFHQQQNKLNSFRQSIQFKQSNINELESKIGINQELLDNTSGEIHDIESNVKNSDDDISLMYQEKDRLDAALQAIETDYFETRGKIEALDNELRQLSKNKETTDQLLGQLKDKKTELDIQLLSIRERLSIEFGIELEEVMEREPSELSMDLEGLELKVEKLKKRIDGFGEVNPFALEAFEEMKERYDFIISQKKDLIEAQKTLLQTIEEIENNATDKFLEAFNKVKDNFTLVFKHLFSEEDVCNLKLSDPDNPLESKVDIIAKPKGKRPLTINQLSGGEKSLTAISLIFGLYLLKPAPFCVLDEVDAPLDDANVGKFNSIIRQFSENSQFIIVTHNKNTMAEVDSIYGVTMAETGVSKVVPVEFANLN